MACSFYGVHAGDKLKLKKQSMQGMETDEILSADNTICVTQDEEATSTLLNELEKEGRHYWLTLNRTKCEYLHFGTAGAVQFEDGTKVPLQQEGKNLGCNPNNIGDPGREVSRRIKHCMGTLAKLQIYFYSCDNTITRK